MNIKNTKKALKNIGYTHIHTENVHGSNSTLKNLILEPMSSHDSPEKLLQLYQIHLAGAQ